MNVFWVDLSSDLQRWQTSLSTGEDAPEIPRLQIAAWLQERGLEGDRACMEWIATGRWPQLTPDLRWQLGLRLGKAAQLASLMALAPVQDPARNPALEWLLIHVWNVDGPIRAQRMASELPSP